MTLDLTPWPRSLLGIPLAVAMFAIQALPLIRLVSDWLQYAPGAILYAAAIGVALEVLLGRVSFFWLAVPIAAGVLSTMPRRQEREQVEVEREQVAQADDPTFGPGADGMPLTVSDAATARELVRRYDVPLVYAPRELVSVDYVAVRPPSRPSGKLLVSPAGEEPEGTIMFYYQTSPFERGALEGWDLILRANWPSGRTRTRVGVALRRVGLPAFPLAGCPLGDWLKDEPCRIRWSRPIQQEFGYSGGSGPEKEAETIAQLVGLKRRKTAD